LATKLLLIEDPPGRINATSLASTADTIAHTPEIVVERRSMPSYFRQTASAEITSFP
jgi:hypothetical protein